MWSHKEPCQGRDFAYKVAPWYPSLVTAMTAPLIGQVMAYQIIDLIHITLTLLPLNDEQ